MSHTVQRTFPLTILSVLTLFLLASWFTVDPTVSKGASILKAWLGILFNVSFLFGIVVLLRLHTVRLYQRKPGLWAYSVLTLGSFIVTIALGFGLGTSKNPAWDYVIDIFFTFPSTVFYGMVAFYVVTSCYRAFRMRNLDAATLLICAIFGLSTSSTIMETYLPFSVLFGNWLINVPTLAGNRVLAITLGLGAVALGVRAILWQQKTFAGISD